MGGEAHLVGDDEHRHALAREVASSPPAPRRPARDRAPRSARRTASPSAPSRAPGRSRRAAAGRPRAAPDRRQPCRRARPRRAAPGRARAPRASACRPRTRRSASATFSSAVMCGHRLNCWNTMPIARRIARSVARPRRPCRPRRRRSRPAARRCGSRRSRTSRKLMQRSSVLLPEPEGPIRQTTLPERPIERLDLLAAPGCAPKLLLTLASSIDGRAHRLCALCDEIAPSSDFDPRPDRETASTRSPR